MDKYRKVTKPKDTSEKPENEIRITAAGSVSSYVSRAAKVYGELNSTKVVITATGNALSKAVTLAEVVKRRFKGLHQITKVGSQEIVDEYEPKEEGLEKVFETRNMATIEITLSKDALDTADVGYQAPIDESLVKELDAEELAKPRGRGRGRGKGRGKGKSKGKGKEKGKGKGKGKGKEESKGKGKGKGKGEPKGKGKGKGKGKDEPKGKGKGKGKDSKGKSKGKGKSYDYWDEPPSKGKGKGKGKGSSKGKGKGKYDDWYDDWSKGSKGKSKGKGKDKGKGKGKKDWW